MLTIMPVRFVSSHIPVGVESPYSKVLLLLTGKKSLKKVIIIKIKLQNTLIIFMRIYMNVVNYLYVIAGKQGVAGKEGPRGKYFDVDILRNLVNHATSLVKSIIWYLFII